MNITAELNRLRECAATGLLHISGEDWSSSIVYLMDGEVIACAGADDQQRLIRLVVDAQLATMEQVESLKPRMDAGEDLIDLLLVQGAPLQDLLIARGTLFDDNIAWALANPSPQGDFEERDAVFPDHMLLDLNAAALVSEVEGWVQSIQPIIEAVSNHQLYFAASGERPEDWADEDWAELSKSRTMAEMLEFLGPPRTEASLLVLDWLQTGILGPLTEDDRAATDLVEALEGGELTEDGDDESQWEETVDMAEVEAAEAVNLVMDTADLPPVAMETGAEPPINDQAETEEDDYDRASRGAFVRSYDVLDHVDLTDVPILGAGTEVVRAGEKQSEEPDIGEESLPPIEMGEYTGAADEEAMIEGEPYEEEPMIEGEPYEEEPIIEAEAYEEPAVLDGALDEPPPIIDGPPPVIDGPPPIADLAEATDAAPPVQSDSSFSVDTSPWANPQTLGDLEAVDAEAEPGEAVPAPVVSSPELPAVNPEEGPFQPEQLTAMLERIGVFNSIFCIIFETFAEHLGNEATRERFATLLATATTASPELLGGLSTHEDGSLSPEALLANVAAAQQEEPMTGLHKGLYELLFSHLYDAKDLLPGEAEAAMMERLVEYERMLHQA